MKTFRHGTPAFGVFLGILFAALGVLWMTIGFWKMLLLAALFAAGYFIGAVSNKEQFVKDTVNRVIPEKKDKPIDLRSTLTREQEEADANVSGRAEQHNSHGSEDQGE